MATVDIKEVDYQTGTDNKTLYVYWTWSERNNHTDHYEIQWDYATGDGYKFVGTTTTVKQSDFIGNKQKMTSTYSIPTNAIKVYVSIKPVSETYESGNNKEQTYWTASWSSRYEFKVSSTVNDPTKPSTPTISIDGVKLTVSVNNYRDENNTSYPKNHKLYIRYRITNKTSLYEQKDIEFKNITGSSYTIKSVPIGGQYRVRCRAVIVNTMSMTGMVSIPHINIQTGAASMATYATPVIEEVALSEWTDLSDYAYTIPENVDKFDSVKAYSSTSVELKWTKASNATGYEIEYTDDKYLFGKSEDVQSSKPEETDSPKTVRIISGLETGKEWFFRIRAYNAQGESSWCKDANIRSIILGEKPNPPTTWSSTATAIAGESVVLYWTHNTKDESEQTAAEIKYNNGQGDKTISITGTSSSHILTLQASAAPFEWQVRTKGILDKWSGWSTTRQISVYSKPAVSIQLTGGVNTVTSYPIDLHIDCSSSSGHEPISYSVTVSVSTTASFWSYDQNGGIVKKSKGDVVYSDIIRSSLYALNVSISPQEAIFDNNKWYTAIVVVGFNSGLSATSHITFKCSFADTDYRPQLGIGIDRSLSKCVATLSPYCTLGSNSETLATNAVLSVYRVNNDGSTVMIAENEPNRRYHYVTDPHPSLNTVKYRVVSIDRVNGSVEFADFEQYVGETAIILQWNEVVEEYDDYADGQIVMKDPIVGQFLRLPYNIDVTDNSAIDVSLVEYIGRSSPVSYYGTQIGHSATWNVDILKSDTETLDKLRHLARWMGDVYVREPSGSGYWANVGVSFSQKHKEVKIPVTLTIKRVEGSA